MASVLACQLIRAHRQSVVVPALLLVACALLAGCSIAGAMQSVVAAQYETRYDYRKSLPALPLYSAQGTRLILAVVDRRPDVFFGGALGPESVGRQTGPLHPLVVTTTSGNAMSEDMSEALAAGLNRAGYRVVEARAASDSQTLAELASLQEAERIVVLTVNEWKTVAEKKYLMTLYCDLVLQVLDQQGLQLAKTSIRFGQQMKPQQWSRGLEDPERMATDAFAREMARLFHCPLIRAALP